MVQHDGHHCDGAQAVDVGPIVGRSHGEVAKDLVAGEISIIFITNYVRIYRIMQHFLVDNYQF